MSYYFDGVNDSINFASDASLDGFTQQSISVWFSMPSLGVLRCILAKDRAASIWEFLITTGNVLTFRHLWSGSTAVWNGSTVFAAATFYHIAMTYDGALTTNDPVMYVNGVLETVTEATAPSGTLSSDATPNLIAGLRGDNGADFKGRMLALNYDSVIWSAADVNRARWWGTRGGGVKVYQPFYSDANNRGTAVAPGTVTGATKDDAPVVERNWMGMMGVGR